MGWSDLLLGTEDAGAVDLVQQPVPRPAPIERPGSNAPMRRRAAPSVGAPTSTPKSYSDDLFGEPPLAQPAPQQAQPQATPTAPALGAEPDAPTWYGRAAQMVRGKQDPRYRDTPTIAEVLLKEGKLGPGSGLGSEAWGWLTGSSDKEMADVYGPMLGERFVRTEQDANGYPVIVYKDQQGRDARAYVNKPGLDVQDVVRGGVEMGPFGLVGRGVAAATKGARLIPKMVMQGLAQGGTAVAQDAAGVVTGYRDLDLDKTKTKAAFAAGGGAAGELLGAGISALARRVVGEPKLFNRTTGKLTPQGEALAREMNVDLEGLPPDALRKFAHAMMDKADPEVALRGMANDEFKIRRSLGEVTGNKQQLLREQQMQGGAYGDDAAKNMDVFRKAQEADLRSIGSVEAARLAPDRVGSSIAKGDVGSNISVNTQAARQNAKEWADKAWKEVPEIAATDEALADLPSYLNKGFAKMPNVLVTEGRTPKAAEMLQDIEQFMAGKAPAQVSALAPKSPIRDVNAMRENLLDLVKAAEPGSRDAKVAGAIYDAYNDWIVKAAELSGDTTAAAKLVVARGMTRQMHEIFTGKTGSHGAAILKKVLEQGDTPELIVNALFTAPARSEIKTGSREALLALKRGYDTYLPPDAAKAAWDDIRMAFWLRTVQQKTGETGGPAAMSTAIKGMLKNQGSLAKLLYRPKELGRFRRLAATLDDVKQRNPNSSWSAIGIGAYLKDLSDAVLSMIGANSVAGKMAIRFASGPIRNQYGAVQARKATGNLGGFRPKPRDPLSLGDLGAGTGAQFNNQ
jgi:hypothetical protein